MEKTMEESVVEIFKQLTPVNQQYFMTILRVAGISQDNARKSMDGESGIAPPSGAPDVSE